MARYDWRRIGATICGCIAIAAETRIAIPYVFDPASPDVWYQQPLVQAVCVAGALQAMAAIVTMAAWRERRFGVATIAALGFIAAVAFTVSTTFERASSAREDKALTLAATSHGKSTAAARAESAREVRDAECKARGPKCAAAEAALADARAIYASTGAGKAGNYLGRFELVPVLALPLMLLLLGLAFIAFAEAPSKRDSEQTSFPTEGDDPLPGRELFEPIAGVTQPKPDGAKRTADIRSFAEQFERKHGVAPSVRTIARATGISPTAVQRRLKRRAGR